MEPYVPCDECCNPCPPGCFLSGYGLEQVMTAQYVVVVHLAPPGDGIGTPMAVWFGSNVTFHTVARIGSSGMDGCDVVLVLGEEDSTALKTEGIDMSSNLGAAAYSDLIAYRDSLLNAYPGYNVYLRPRFNTPSGVSFQYDRTYTVSKASGSELGFAVRIGPKGEWRGYTSLPTYKSKIIGKWIYGDFQGTYRVRYPISLAQGTNTHTGAGKDDVGFRHDHTGTPLLELPDGKVLYVGGTETVWPDPWGSIYYQRKYYYTLEWAGETDWVSGGPLSFPSAIKEFRIVGGGWDVPPSAPYCRFYPPGTYRKDEVKQTVYSRTGDQAFSNFGDISHYADQGATPIHIPDGEDPLDYIPPGLEHPPVLMGSYAAGDVSGLPSIQWSAYFAAGSPAYKVWEIRYPQAFWAFDVNAATGPLANHHSDLPPTWAPPPAPEAVYPSTGWGNYPTPVSYASKTFATIEASANGGIVTKTPLHIGGPYLPYIYNVLSLSQPVQASLPTAVTDNIRIFRRLSDVDAAFKEVSGAQLIGSKRPTGGTFKVVHTESGMSESVAFADMNAELLQEAVREFDPFAAVAGGNLRYTVTTTAELTFNASQVTPTPKLVVTETEAGYEIEFRPKVWFLLWGTLTQVNGKLVQCACLATTDGDVVNIPTGEDILSWAAYGEGKIATGRISGRGFAIGDDLSVTPVGVPFEVRRTWFVDKDGVWAPDLNKLRRVTWDGEVEHEIPLAREGDIHWLKRPDGAFLIVGGITSLDGNWARGIRKLTPTLTDGECT